MTDQDENRVACFTIGIITEAHTRSAKTSANGLWTFKGVEMFPWVHEFERMLGFLDMLFPGVHSVPEFAGNVTFRTNMTKNEGQSQGTLAISFSQYDMY